MVRAHAPTNIETRLIVALVVAAVMQSVSAVGPSGRTGTNLRSSSILLPPPELTESLRTMSAAGVGTPPSPARSDWFSPLPLLLLGLVTKHIPDGAASDIGDRGGCSRISMSAPVRGESEC